MLCIVASTDLRANGFTGPLSKCLDCFAILRGGFTAIDIMSVPQCVCVCVWVSVCQMHFNHA